MIGIGGPRGDDAVGLHVARRLASEGLPPDVDHRLRDRPGLDLAEDLEGVGGAVLVDALRSGAEPGSVRAVAAETLVADVRLSSHGLGVAHALALSRALGRRLPPLRVVGIELGRLDGIGLSPLVERAVTPACRAVRRALAELARA